MLIQWCLSGVFPSWLHFGMSENDCETRLTFVVEDKTFIRGEKYQNDSENLSLAFQAIELSSECRNTKMIGKTFLLSCQVMDLQAILMHYIIAVSHCRKHSVIYLSVLFLCTNCFQIAGFAYQSRFCQNGNKETRANHYWAGSYESSKNFAIVVKT